MRGEIQLVAVTVKVDLEGKNYLTNVLACREDAEEDIYKRAIEQVKKQMNEQ